MKKIICAILVLPNLLFAQKNTEQEGGTIKEVIVSATKQKTTKSSIAQKVEVITAEEIAKTNAPSTGDLLMQTGQVFVQKSQLGGSSPVIRGFEANRILITVDGVRMNNAVYRGGHLQNVITVDQNMLERVEIVSGPSSTLYGSDALGGVINFQTKAIKYNNRNTAGVTNAGAFVRYSSACNEVSANANITLASDNFGSLTSITYNKFGDLQAGKNRASIWGDFGLRKFTQSFSNGKDTLLPNSNTALQTLTGYSQYDILQKFSWQPNKNITHQLNFQLSNSSNVPRFDRLGEVYTGKINGADSLGWGAWYYGPQTRAMAAYSFKIKNVGVFNEVNLNTNFQYVQEIRNQRRWASKFLQTRTEDINVLGTDIYGIINRSKYDLTLGIDNQFNDVNSHAVQTSTTTNAFAVIRPRYAAGQNLMNLFGAYAQGIYKLVPNKWILNAGARFAATSLSADISDKSFYKFPTNKIVQKNNAITGNFGLIFTPCNFHKFSIGISTGFKAPNLDEVTKFFDNSAKGSAVVVPNINLKPETAVNFDAGYRFSNNKFYIEVNAFYTQLNNAMVLNNSTYDGKDSIIYDGLNTPVIAITNQAKAIIMGANTNFGITLNKFFVDAAINFTQGKYTSTSKYKIGDSTVPMDHIPPMFGKLAIGYKTKKWQVEAWSLFNGKKDIKDFNPFYFSEDNKAYALPTGVPAWQTFNARGSYTIVKNTILQVGIENILDTYYRHFASGIAAPGRNIITAIRYKL